MPEPTTPPATTGAGGTEGQRPPRTLSHAEIRERTGDGFTTLPALRNHTLIRYEDVWWVADRDGYIEIVDAEHNHRLDRWHARLSNGALWT
jgi:hypothetical protein